MEVYLLHILSPLYFASGEDPFRYKGETGGSENVEKLFCFDLAEDEYLSFEPDKNKLLGETVFGEKLELPQGDYLFAQQRKILNREDIIALAVEIQQEGLWQRLTPGKRLYLRYLFEDGSFVTQVLRPYTKNQRRTASTM